MNDDTANDNRQNRASACTSESGFSYIDVLIGMMILLIGVMALSSAVTIAVVRSRSGEQQLLAKQISVSSIESIHSARDIGSLGWNAICTRATGTPCVFVGGNQQVTERPGADGIIGTSDDASATSFTQQTGKLLPNFRRTIEITDIPDPQNGNAVFMRRVKVTVFYRASGLWQQESGTTIISKISIEDE